MTTTALASAVGISPPTLRNIACGNSSSRRARQAITDALGVEIWPDILPKERRLSFERGDQAEFETVEQAKEMAAEFRSFVKRRGKTVTFIRSVSFVIRYDPAGEKISESINVVRPSLEAAASGTPALERNGESLEVPRR